jgi:LPXTG-site transpeptidase (sortase) family protein
LAFRAVGLDGKPALHRVVAIVGDGDDAKLYVKGDNNPMIDGAPVTRDNYIGRVIFRTNITAVYMGILRGPNGVVWSIIVPIVFLLLLYVGARFLIGSTRDWRTKGIAIAAVVMLISAGLLFSYVIYTVKQVSQTNTSLGKIASDFAQSTTDTTWKVNGENVLGRIEIPSLKLDYPIIKYQAATSLNTTIAEFSGAGVNVSGNEVLVGHRAFGDVALFNLFFTNIDQLKTGDKIYLTGLDRERVTYVVTWAKVVTPDDNSVLAASGDAVREVTLIAATYDLRNRYVVRAVAAP